jgi:hypothetical protein
MNIQLITIASGPAHDPNNTFDEMLNSLKVYGLSPTILAWGEEWRGLGTKPKILLKHLKENDNADYTIFFDAYDVLFLAHPETILKKAHLLYPEAEIVFNAERFLFPPDIENGDALYPPIGKYRYLNSGFFIGLTSSIITFLESLNLDQYPDDFQKEDGTWHHEQDGKWFLENFPKQVVPMQLDCNAHLCQTLHCEPFENFDVDLSCNEVKNIITNSNPLVLHGNGNGKENPLMKQLKQKF